MSRRHSGRTIRLPDSKPEYLTRRQWGMVHAHLVAGLTLRETGARFGGATAREVGVVVRGALARIAAAEA